MSERDDLLDWDGQDEEELAFETMRKDFEWAIYKRCDEEDRREAAK